MNNKSINKEEEEAILEWWSSLQEEKKADRAILKRASSIEDVLVTKEFRTFLFKIPEKSRKPYLDTRNAIIASVLAHIKINTTNRFINNIYNYI